MKTLADLKRVIKIGTRLRCIENTYRPELNDTMRTVIKTQTNAFVWRQDGQTDPRGSWTYFPKADKCEIDGDIFKLALTDAYGHQHNDHYVKLEVQA